MKDKELQAKFEEANNALTDTAGTLINLSKLPGLSEHWQELARKRKGQLLDTAQLLAVDLRGSVVRLETLLAIAEKTSAIDMVAFVDVVIHVASDVQLSTMLEYTKHGSDDRGCFLCRNIAGTTGHADTCPVTLIERHLAAEESNKAAYAEQRARVETHMAVDYGGSY